MKIREPIDETGQALDVLIPLTNGSGKTRIKQRNHYNEYGVPQATKQIAFSDKSYVEWQIGYDVIVSDAAKLALTSLPSEIFTGADGQVKALYELSEYIYYFHKWGIVSEQELAGMRDFLLNLSNDDFIENPGNFSITRAELERRNFLGVDFECTKVEYPLLIHWFGIDDSFIEIKITERQKASGVQPMIYFCFPVSKLRADAALMGRTAETKEMAVYRIDAANIAVFTSMLKIFGMLSDSHRKDVISKISKILA